MFPQKKIFTALPAAGNAQRLAIAYRKLLIDNLLRQLQSVQSSLGLDISNIKKKYRGLQAASKFSPAVHFAETKLSVACDNTDVEILIDSVYRLQALSEKEIFNNRFSVSSILSEPWEVDYVQKLRKDNFSKKAKLRVFPILNDNLGYFEKIIGKAYKTIQQIDIDFYQEIDFYITRIKLFNGTGLIASSSSAVFGAIYLNLPDEGEDHLLYFIEHIVHETSHHQLEILFAFDPIILNADSERFKSPLRKDPRPMLGIFHATFVLARMTRIFNRLYRHNRKKEYQEKANEFKKMFLEGLAVVSENAKLTTKGKLILSSLLQTAEIS